MVENEVEEEIIVEKIPESLKPVIEIAGKGAEKVLRKIDERLNKPEVKSAEAVVQLTTGQELRNAVEKYFKGAGKIMWGNAKALGIGALSLIPILGGAGEAATVDLIDAGVLEGATKAQAKALAKGAIVTESGAVAKPLSKVLGEKGAEKMSKILKELDPFPDIPAGVVAASGIAEASGLEGAGLIPSGLQVLINEYRGIKLGFGTIKEIMGIFSRSPEVNRVIGKIKDRIDKAGSPEMQKAAQAFA